jgi:spore maturation protein CgeB
LRILVVHPGAQFSVSDCYDGWVEALREQGQTVQEFNLGELLQFYDSAYLMTGTKSLQNLEQFRKALSHEQAIEMAAARMLGTVLQFMPDVIFAVSGFFLNPRMLDLLHSRGIKIVMLHTESPYEDGVQLERAVRCDISLVNDPTNLETFRKASKIAEYMPHAYRPSIHHPGKSTPQLESDFAFVGTGYGSRCEFFEAMDFRDLDVLLAGNWCMLDDASAASMLGPGGGRTDSPLRKYVAHGLDECVDNVQAVEIYRSTKVSLNLYRREINAEDRFATQTGWAMGPREIELAACGTFFLRDPRPEGDEILSFLPQFTSPEEASEQLHYWLARPGDCADMAAKAREAVADRTFVNHAAKVLKMIERL